MQVRMTLGGVAFGLLLWGPLATLETQVTGPGPDGTAGTSTVVPTRRAPPLTARAAIYRTTVRSPI